MGFCSYNFSEKERENQMGWVPVSLRRYVRVDGITNDNNALFIDNKSLPVGKKWYKNFNKTEKYLGKLRSDLENEFCRQHPDGWSTKVFW